MSGTAENTASTQQPSTRKRPNEAISTNNNEEIIVCPYLDTIQRSLLDFDVAFRCSVTLETGPHIYGCLVCGNFFRGRGPRTPAYTHAVQESHYCFVHLQQGRFYCLPEDYEIRDVSLGDIKHALLPVYTQKQVQEIDRNTELSRDFLGKTFLPGFVGMSNLQTTDCINAVVQALAHVPPIRDFFLLRKEQNIPTKKHNSTTTAFRNAVAVTQAFGQTVRKLWSHQRFKGHVDPHMLVQAIAAASRRYAVGSQIEAGPFVAWLLNQLHMGTGGTRKAGSSVVHETFQGKIEVTTMRQIQNDVQKVDDESDDRLGSDSEEEEKQTDDTPTTTKVETVVSNTEFLQLTLEIPEKPLFRDEDGGLVIPQEPLSAVLKKFDGRTLSDVMTASEQHTKKKYRLMKLPNYLILHLARFTTNRYSREKNPTIVAFPVKNLDLSSYTATGKDPLPSEEEVRKMSVKELKALLTKYGQDHIIRSTVEKPELIQSTVDFVVRTLPDLLADKYDLVANITHVTPDHVGKEGKTDPLQEGYYKCHVQHRGTNQWYEMHDLHVQEIMPQQIGLSESYVLIFERKSVQVKNGNNE